MESFLNFILELRAFSSKREEWVILVEGKRDVAALKKLGIENVRSLQGKSFHTVAEEIAEKKKGVVLLMDFDKQGERIFQKLIKVLPKYGLKVDTYFREKLKALGVKYVEDLGGIYGREKLRRRHF